MHTGRERNASDQPSGLAVKTLGRLTITWAGQEVSDLTLRKSQALLVYLATHPGQHDRGRLAGMFWGELPEEQARRNLRRALFGLRARFGPALLEGDRLAIGLSRQVPCQVDLLTFEAEMEQAGRCRRSQSSAAAIRHLEAAIALYKGDFLADFELPDCLEFTDWVLLRRAGLQERAMEALDCLADYWMQRGEYERGLRYARQQLTLEPWWEEAHRRVMTLLALSGQRSAALAQYYQCRRTLRANLDILPDEQTQALYRRIIQESRGLMPTTLLGLSGHPLHLASAWPEWEKEWERLPTSALRLQLLAGLIWAAERVWREYNHADTLGFLGAALDLMQPEDIERRWELLSTRERVYHFIADRAAQGRDLGELEKLAEHLTDAARVVALRVRQMQHACRLGNMPRHWRGANRPCSRQQKLGGRTYWPEPRKRWLRCTGT